MIFRTVHNRDNPYFQLNRSAVDDERLSYKAIGIHTYLMSKPDGWEANESDITNRHSDGRAAVRSGIKELIDYGYIHRSRITDEYGRVVEWKMDVYETPELNPYWEKSPDCENRIVVPDYENRIVESTPVNPQFDFPQVENPQVENRIHSNYIYTVNNELQQLAGGGSRQTDADYAAICNAVEQEGFGMMTPFIAEEIKTMLDDYPVEWILDAMKVSVNQNKRKLSYAAGILRRWRADGRDSTKQDVGKPTVGWQGYGGDVPDYMREARQ